MEEDALKDSLKRLHAELNATEHLDADLVELVAQLDEDIHRLVHEDESKPGESLTQRMDQLAAEFAVRHPSLTPILREIGDTLARMGI